MIIDCLNCGKKNRVPDILRADGQYYCAACQAVLIPSLKTPQPYYRFPSKRVLSIAAIGGAIALSFAAGSSYSSHIPPPATASPNTEVQTSATIPSPEPPPPIQEAHLAPSVPTPSVPNGTEFITRNLHPGFGKLTISNGSDQDAVVKLVGDPEGAWQQSTSSQSLPRLRKRAYRSIYVAAHNYATLEKIGTGCYSVLFALGSGWQGNPHGFARNRSFSKFQDSLAFGQASFEEGGRSGIRYDTYQISLTPVISGNAKTTAIDEREFDATDEHSTQ